MPAPSAAIFRLTPMTPVEATSTSAAPRRALRPSTPPSPARRPSLADRCRRWRSRCWSPRPAPAAAGRQVGLATRAPAPPGRGSAVKMPAAAAGASHATSDRSGLPLRLDAAAEARSAEPARRGDAPGDARDHGAIDHASINASRDLPAGRAAAPIGACCPQVPKERAANGSRATIFSRSPTHAGQSRSHAHEVSRRHE